MSKTDAASADQPFVDLVLTGRAFLQDIDSYVAEWHNAPEESLAAKLELHEYLGLSWEEYRLWVEKPESLRFTLMSRQRGAPLDQILKSATQNLQAAARSTNSKDARKVYEWLVDRGRIGDSPKEA